MRFINDTLLRLYCWAKDEKAQTMAEYGLILALISVAAIAALLLLGPQLKSVFTSITDALKPIGA
jgi:pilus assembly protein Flp/PilA